MPAASHHVVIIGGGITGLAAAFALTERASGRVPPITCTLIEADDRLGGKILTDRVGGIVIEGGPESFLSQKPWAMELCRQLGLSERLIGTNPERRHTFVLSRGRLRDLPEGLVMGLPTKLAPFLKSDLLSWAGKCRIAAELLLPRARQSVDESLASFFRRRLGDEAFERMIEPLLGGIYAGDAEQLSIEATFPRFREMEREHGSLVRSMLSTRSAPAAEDRRATPFMALQGGLGEMVERLSARLKTVNILTGRRVREFRLQADGLGYQVMLADGSALPADAVVITAPAYDAASLLASLHGPLADELRSIPYMSTATVSLGFRKRDVGHALNGYGFVVPRVEGRSLLASTWTSSKWSHRAPDDSVLLRVYLGGAHDKSVMDRTDSELAELMRSELRGILGIDREPLLVKVYRWPRSMPQYHVGHLQRLDRIEGLLQQTPGIYVAGAGYRGVGIPDCIHDGARAAERVLTHFDKTANPSV